MADSELVKDVMFPAVQLNKNTTVGEALQELNRNNALYAVVSDFAGRPLGIVTKDNLSAAKANEFVQVPSSGLPYSGFIDPYVAVDGVVKKYEDYFKFNQNLMGIVVREQGEVHGVLLRETILSMSRIAGTPVLLFRCTQCPKGVDCPGVRRSPPQCPKDPRRKMNPVTS